jgi:hypothetical protein
MSETAIDATRASGDPFGMRFNAYDGETRDLAFCLHIEPVVTNPNLPDFRRYINLELHSPDARIQMIVPASLDKAQVLDLAQFLRDVAAKMEDNA